MSDNSEDNLDNSDDFEFKNKKGSKKQDDLKTKKIENQHMDEAVELASDGSQISSQEEEEDHDEPVSQKQQQPNPRAGKPAAMEKDDNDDDYDQKSDNLPGAYNPADYSHLKVSNEIKELFKYITRYQPEIKDLESQLRPFVPDYFPAVGEVDAFIKMPRPDNKEETLGLNILDEPCLNQSNRAVLQLKYKDLIKKTKDEKTQVIHSIPNAEKNPKEIQMWINNVAQIRKTKQPHSVVYSKPMPEIDDLMQVWPSEIENALGQIKIPSEELDLNLEDFSRLSCAILDIPVHESVAKTNIIESLHVLFTLYSEFKANQHFQQNKNDQPQYDQMQLQIN